MWKKEWYQKLKRIHVDYLQDREKVYYLVVKKLYNETKIDENTLNGILNGKIQPQRDDLIQMSLVLNIDLKKTNFMLSLAECETLSYKESRDSLIICAIKNHYSINKTNMMLSTCNLIKI